MTDKVLMFFLYKELFQIDKNKTTQFLNLAKDLSWQLGEKQVQVTNEHIKRYFNLPAVRGGQIKITMRYYVIAIKLWKILKHCNTYC